MSIEKALIARAQPYFLAARAQAFIDFEALKGCSPAIFEYPVDLEPPYMPIALILNARNSQSVGEIPGFAGYPAPNPTCLKAWASPNYIFDWIKTELFLKGLRSSVHRLGFEIIGNKDFIEMGLIVHPDDIALLEVAFKGQHEGCELTSATSNRISSINNLIFRDYYPSPPYSHLFTQPMELRLSPFDIIFEALARIIPPAVGIYQVLFKGTNPEHDWHKNISILNDFEYAIKLMANLPMVQRSPYQSPSGELRGMAMDNENKAHNDKPMFVAALRLGIFGANDIEAYMPGLAACINLIQHGGKALNYLSEKDYQMLLSSDKLKDMFILGDTYRPGFLLNSSELASMVHIPSIESIIRRKTQIQVLETLIIANDDLLKGTPIGMANYADTKQAICIPPDIRFRNTHLIASQGLGKSTVMEHMALHDLNAGDGVAILDPHGDLVSDLLHLIPENCLDRTIYLSWNDPNWVPLWNPLKTLPNQDITRTTDEIVSAIKHVVQGWGDRLENFLRHAVFALLHLDNSTFLDISNLLRKNSKESRQLIDEILHIVDNETSRLFWKNDFSRYTNQDLSPPQHKLSKLLMSGNVSAMFSQPENRINFREIMDTGKILLVDLSGPGPETQALLGSFILSLFHIATLSRSDIPKDSRKDFHIYCDEAHKFLTTSFKDLIPESRKFRVSLTLAHQYLKQFEPDMRDAILTTGTKIIFSVDLNDAKYLVKDLQGLVEPEELTGFGVGEAIAKIGNSIVKIRTIPPPKQLNPYFAQKIVDESHKKYYASDQNVIKRLNKLVNNNEHIIPGRSHDINGDEDIKWDEFA